MAIGAIGANAINAGIGAVAGAITAGVQHKYNKKLADYQNDINIENWNLQNEYNSPANQRKRLDEAGINPAAVFGSNNTGNAGQIAQYQRQGVDITQSLMNGAQLSVLAAQARKTNAEAANTEAQNPYAGATAQAILDGYLVTNEKTKADTGKVIAETKNVELSYSKIQNEIVHLQGAIELQLQQTNSEKERTKLIKAQTTTELLNQALIKVNTDNAKKTGDLLHNQNILTQAQAKQVNASAVMQEFKNLYYERFGIFPDAGTWQLAVQAGFSAADKSAGTAVGVVGKIKNKRQAKKALKQMQNNGVPVAPR